jgi:ribosomal protein L7/L12
VGFREEFRGTGNANALRSLEKITETGLRANTQRYQILSTAFKSWRDESITCISQSEKDQADLIREELSYQTEQIHQDVQSSSVELAEAIQRMADYLGEGLSEVRWAVERHTRVSEDTLRLLLSSLNSESRQYWEQGVTCYETREYELAKERLEKALEANRTNFFAYQYLGFIALDEDNPEAAIRNFDLARKFAKNDHDRAIALSHLAECWKAKGDLRNAIDLSKAAVEADPQTPKFRYQHAKYSVKYGDVPAAIASLRGAIERDWGFWNVVSKDRDLDCIRKEINQLLGELKARERDKAWESIAKLKQAVENSKQLSGDQGFTQGMASLRSVEQKFEQDKIQLYLEIQAGSPQAEQNAYQLADKILSGKLRDLNSTFQSLSEDLRKLRERSFAGFGFLCFIGAELAAIFFIQTFFTWGPVREGPFRVFTPSQSMRMTATGEQIAAGSSKQLLSENDSQVTIRFEYGDRTLPRAEILKFGRFETGYVEDDSREISGFGEFLFLGVVPIGLGVLASKLRRQAATSPLMAESARVQGWVQFLSGQLVTAQNWIRAIEAPIVTRSSGPYTASLMSVGGNKINVIKAIREVMGLGLQEAKSMVDGAPRPIAAGISEQEAERIQSVLGQAGATVQVTR